MAFPLKKIWLVIDHGDVGGSNFHNAVACATKYTATRKWNEAVLKFLEDVGYGADVLAECERNPGHQYELDNTIHFYFDPKSLWFTFEDHDDGEMNEIKVEGLTLYH